MFRVVLPPIIRSAYTSIYSIWYLSHRYCYLPLSWKSWNRLEFAVGGVLTMHVPINVKSPNNISKWQMGFNSAFKGLIRWVYLNNIWHKLSTYWGTQDVRTYLSCLWNTLCLQWRLLNFPTSFVVCMYCLVCSEVVKRRFGRTLSIGLGVKMFEGRSEGPTRPPLLT
jgi:hypothetical protein